MNKSFALELLNGRNLLLYFIYFWNILNYWKLFINFFFIISSASEIRGHATNTLFGIQRSWRPETCPASSDRLAIPCHSPPLQHHPLHRQIRAIEMIIIIKKRSPIASLGRDGNGPRTGPKHLTLTPDWVLVSSNTSFNSAKPPPRTWLKTRRRLVNLRGVSCHPWLPRATRAGNKQ